MNHSENWRSLPQRVLDHAAANPDAPAVCQDTLSLRYREAAVRIERYAALLDAMLPADRRVVAVCLARTVDLPLWLLAILHIRAAYVPIDASLPPARLARMLVGANPALILASREFAALLPVDGPRLVIADDLAAGAPVHAAARAAPADPADLAYVMYTSGSTGEPKGVEIEHGAITALLAAMERLPGMAAGMRVLAITRTGFDMSVFELLLPLAAGAGIVVGRSEEAADGMRLSRLIDDARPDVVQGTPATFRMLLDAGWPCHRPATILCGGEAMSAGLAKALLPRCDRLWNVYGPTETTVWSAAHHVEAVGDSVPIGRPIHGTRIAIVDAQHRTMAAGERGEIAIAGPSVARGYRAQPALTAARFVILEDGARYYLTGDIGHAGPDGLLFCHGRNDDQVKIRGFRIELGEVESALDRHPDIGVAAVRAWHGTDEEAFLAAYAVPADGRIPDAAEIKRFLGETLPAYMVPDIVTVLPRLPLTANGKVDRRALADPRTVRRRHAARAEALSAEEAWLAAQWSEILNVPVTRGEDDFFDLGGYSLLTVRLQRRIEQRFGRVLELPQLLRASSLRAMAALIAARGDGGDGAHHGGIALLSGTSAQSPLYWLDAGPLLRGVARALPPTLPMATLNVLRAEEARFGTGPLDLGDVARLLADELRAAATDGPIHLAGWCRWGVVAHELACQLTAAGHEVGLLVLLDAEAPAPRSNYWLRRIRTRRGEAEDGSSFSQRVEAASRHHRASLFDGDALLLRPQGREADRGGWDRLVAGGLAVRAIPGDHLTMLNGAGAGAIARAIAAHRGEAKPARTAAVRREAQLPVIPI